MNKKQIMKAAVNMAKRFEGAWMARMKMALKAAWKQAKFFDKVTYRRQRADTAAREGSCLQIKCYFKGDLFGSVYTDSAEASGKFWTVYKGRATPYRDSLEESVLDILYAQKYDRLKRVMRPPSKQEIVDKLYRGFKIARPEGKELFL